MSERGDCKVADFGLARVAASANGDRMEMTAETGTYRWMAPEARPLPPPPPPPIQPRGRSAALRPRRASSALRRNGPRPAPRRPLQPHPSAPSSNPRQQPPIPPSHPSTPSQVISHKPYNHKADVYSYSIVLYELVAGGPPYQGFPAVQAALAVSKNGLRPTLPDGVDPRITGLMRRCWEENPEDRPEFTDIIASLQARAGGHARTGGRGRQGENASGDAQGRKAPRRLAAGAAGPGPDRPASPFPPRNAPPPEFAGV